MDTQMILTSTDKRKTLMPAANYNKEDAKKYCWQQWTGRYLLNNKKPSEHFVSFVLSSHNPVVFASDEYGNFYSWKFNDDMMLYVLNNYHTHSCSIERISLNPAESSLFTLSSEDSTLCQWDVNMLAAENIPKVNVEKLYKDGIKGTTDAINRELKYAYNSLPMVSKNSLEDKGDLMVLVKGSRDKRMNDILAADEEEKTDSNLKPLVGTLVLERVFGIQCGNRRNTLRYYYSSVRMEEISPKSKEPFHITSEESPRDRVQMAGESIRKSVKCISYYTSHYVILEDPQENAQYIYRAHKAKITCMTIHPGGIIFASGECSNNSSVNHVHVWNSITREPIVVLKTAHESGVSLLDFSFDGSLLLTFGSGKQSVQIFNWEQEREIAFRHLNITPVFDIRFNPQNPKSIIAIGLECILEMALISGSLSIVNIITVSGTSANKRIFLCMDFIQQPSTNIVNTFIGSSLGEVGVLLESKFSMLPNVTHEGAINVLKLSKLLMKPFCLITGGDDDNIKVWDSNMACLATIPVHGFELYREFERINNAVPLSDLGGVQSLDLCPYEEDKPFLLIGMRNGDVLETIIQLKAEEGKSSISANTVGGNRIKVSLEAMMVIDEHSSQGMTEDERKLSICLHPVIPILVSGSYDCTLRFWDMSMNMLLREESLGKTMKVSAITFSPTGTILTLGFTNGTVIFYKFDKGEKEGRAARYEPVIEKVLSIRDTRGTVLLIKYSNDAEFIAISYDAEVVTTSEGKRYKNGKSCVIVYVQSNSNRAPGIQKSKDPYSKVSQIIYPIANIKHEPSILSPMNLNLKVNELSRAFTHMDFSEKNNFLQLCYMPVTLLGKVNYSYPPLCLVWNLNVWQAVDDWETLKNVKWSQWSMAPTVYARILGDKFAALSPEEEAELLIKEEIVFSSLKMFESDKKVCAGSKDGDIHLFRQEALVKANEAHEKSGIVLKNQMEVAKSYSACCSSIEYIEIYSEHESTYVFVSSSSDEVILKYRFERENIKWDLDNYNLIEEHCDPYSELPPYDRFDLTMKECWIPRSRIFELAEKLAPPPHPCNIHTNYVFGRRAYDRRNNLIYDYTKRAIYSVGTMFIILSDKSEELTIGKKGQQKKQKVFPSTKSIANFSSPEISCLCTNCNSHMIALGTAEARAHIYVWDISHNTEIGSVALVNLSLVYCMKFNKDNRHIAAIGLSKDFKQMIVITDTQQQEILAMTTLIHSSPYKIRDLEFYPDSTTRLITAGIQHLTLWKTDGKYMESRCLDLTMTKLKQLEEISGEMKSLATASQKYGAGKLCLGEQFMESPDSDIETVCVTFMSIGFLKKTMITVGDDGFIYIWNEEKIVKKRKGHDDCISCLYIESDSELIITGGNDGYVIAWGLSVGNYPLNRDLIQKASFQVPSIGSATTLLKPISPNLGNTILPAGNCVQSVWLSGDALLIGTRNGAIYTIEAKITPDEFKAKPQFDGSPFYKLLDAVDDEVPKSISYDSRNKRLLCISQRGFLSVWCLETNTLIACKYFDKLALHIHAFSTRANVLVVFENEMNMLNDNYEMENFSIKKSLITAIKVCSNEKFIALACCNDKAPELEIYEIENQFHEFHTIKGYKANIINVDFTNDGKYMMCQNELGDVYMYDRERLEQIENVDEEEVKLHWEGFGLTVDSDFTEVSKNYNNMNQIYAIIRLPNKNIVAIGDQIGSVNFINNK